VASRSSKINCDALDIAIPIVYGAWHTNGVSGDRMLRNSRARVLQCCGQCMGRAGLK